MLAGEEYDELIMSLVEETLQTPQPERDKRLRALCREASVYEEVCRRIEWEQRMGRFLLDPLIERPAPRTRSPPAVSSITASASSAKSASAAWVSSSRPSTKSSTAASP